MRDQWPVARASAIAARARALVERGSATYTFIPSFETDPIRYFSSGWAAELAALSPAPFRFVAPLEGLSEVDVLIVTAHGADLYACLWKLRAMAAEPALLAVWLWDNHTETLNNARTVLAADLVFPSHAYAAGYLFNPASITAVHLPACTAQWTCDEAARLFAAHAGAIRRDKLLVNYVDYSGSWRRQVLNQLAAVPEAQVLVMPEDHRRRYFSKTSSERFAEWAEYKATVILPLDRDLSTRVFDALLAGLIPVVPRMVHDFDLVVPPAIQEALGIVRIDGVDVASIRTGAALAFQRYDRMGRQGAMLRHRYVLEQHSLVSRVLTVLEVVRQLGTGQAMTRFMEGPDAVGLCVVPHG
jgi:hypothetical protein